METSEITKATHLVTFWKMGEPEYTQQAFGKNDVFEVLRSAMSDGYTHFKIVTLPKNS